MRKNPRVEVTTPSGQTALHILASKGAVEIIEALVRKGADIKKEDYSGETVLFHGLGTGQRYQSLAKLFASGNGDLNATNKQGVC